MDILSYRQAELFGFWDPASEETRLLPYTTLTGVPRSAEWLAVSSGTISVDAPPMAGEVTGVTLGFAP